MARKERPEVEEFSFEDILEEIESSSKEIECGPYKVKELTMQHQRKNITAGMEPVEAPLRTNRLFNEYIKENVESTDSFGDICDIVDISERPYLINLLRVVTVGSEYIVKDKKTNEDKTYMIYEVGEEDFINEEKSKEIECGSMIITIEIPTISKDERISEQLSVALEPFKKRTIKDDDYGKIAETYYVYEIMKYIHSITKNNNEILFDTLSLSNKKKFIDKLPIRYIESISEFMNNVKEQENRAFTAYNPNDSEDSISIDLNNIFSAKNI